MGRNVKVVNGFNHTLELWKERAGTMGIKLDDRVDIAVSRFMEHDMLQIRDHLNKAYPVAKNKDVTNILLDVVPGPDGMGHEVYAESVEQVERRLCDLGDKVENLTDDLRQARHAHAQILEELRAFHAAKAWTTPAKPIAQEPTCPECYCRGCNGECIGDGQMGG